MRRAVVLAVLVLAGCGGDDGESGPRLIDPATALGLSGGTEVRVRGFFSHDAGTLVPRMCTQLAESYPPTCAMPSLPVSNMSEAQENALPLKRDPETRSRWTETEVEVVGRIEEGALVVE